MAADARMCVTYRVRDVCHHRLAAPTTAGWSTVKIVGSTGVDPGDIAVVARWLTADEALDDAALELALREMLDPAGQRTARPASACPESGRLPGPNLVLVGWHPCACGGHATSHCRADNGGCGNTVYEPPIDPERCSDAPFGFSG